jgi:hypothetical protein
MYIEPYLIKGLSVAVLFVMTTLYIMRRRVRLGRKKGTF